MCENCYNEGLPLLKRLFGQDDEMMAVLDTATPLMNDDDWSEIVDRAVVGCEGVSHDRLVEIVQTLSHLERTTERLNMFVVGVIQARAKRGDEQAQEWMDRERNNGKIGPTDAALFAETLVNQLTNLTGQAAFGTRARPTDLN